METTHVLVFGADSLVGSHFVQRETAERTISCAGRTDPKDLGLPPHRFLFVDFADVPSVERLVRDSNADSIVNFAARTDVDGIERERPPDKSPNIDSPAYVVNAIAPGAIARAAHDTGKYFVQLSTDFVFDGRHGPYDETMLPSPLSENLGWYGWTKGEGERRVRSSLPGAAIVRISYPYRASFPRKSDFARGLLQRRRAGTLPSLYVDQTITPTWIPDVGEFLGLLLRDRRGGVFHVASPIVTTPREFGRELFLKVDGDARPVPTAYIADRSPTPGVAPRPIHGGLRTVLTAKLGAHFTSWREGIEALAREGVAR